MAAGAKYGITPYGTETMHVLRAEKGFIIVGQDTDGSVTPVDLGMDWIVAKGKDFLGRRSLSRADTARADRKHLVGLLTDDPKAVLPEGGQIVTDAARAAAGADARPRDVELLQRLPRAVDRAGARAEWPQPHGREGARVAARRARDSCGDRQAGVPRSRRGAAECLIPSSAKARSRASSSGRAPTYSPGHAGVIAREHPFLGHLNLRGNAQDPRFVGAVSDVLGDGLPLVANTVTDVQGITMYWLGPDEWLIVTPGERRAGVEGELRKVLAGLRVAVTDVSGGQTVLQLHGAHVRDVLAKGCPIDLHPRAFSIGQCAQSHLAKAPILIGQIENQPYFELIFRRSFADYLWTWLEGAAAEYGLEVAA